MSILQTTSTTPVTAAPPYRTGDRITVTSPEGERFVGRVETVTARSRGDFMVLAAIKEPRRYRNHVLSTVVDASGAPPALRPAV